MAVIRIVLAATLLLFVGLHAPPAAAQAGGGGDLKRGRFLVASRQVADPNFGQTVIVLVDYGAKSAMGLIVNRPTQLSLAKLLPQLPELAERGDVAWLGGPVESSKMFLLIRADEEFEDTEFVADGLLFSASAAVLERLASGHQPSRGFRAYAGYAGWAPGQLDAEVARGDWHVLPGDAGVVFDANPEGLWERLIERSDIRIAQALGVR